MKTGAEFSRVNANEDRGLPLSPKVIERSAIHLKEIEEGTKSED